MKTSIKDVGFAVFFLVVIAVVAVQAAEEQGENRQEVEPVESPRPAGSTR